MRLRVSVIVDMDTTDTDIADMRNEILAEAKAILDRDGQTSEEKDCCTGNQIIIMPLRS